MRIIHLSDFHLDKSKLTPFNNIVYQLECTLKMINEEKKIDLIIFTGDMINQGGRSFPTVEDAFEAFKKIFIIRLCTAIKLPLNRFIFTMGNHDVRRDKDSKATEIGLQSLLKDLNSVSDIIDNEDSDNCVNRIVPFKEFEKEFYSGILTSDEYKFSKFCSNFKLQIEGHRIGISTLNTAWRCWDSDKDRGNIWMGPSQIRNSIEFLSDCDLKVAISHHKYEWLKVEERLNDEQLLAENYDMYFCGHTHSSTSDYKLSPNGNSFEVVAPGILSDNINETNYNYKNGFGLIDYDFDESRISTSVFRQINGESFCKDLNFGNNGLWAIDIPQGEIATVAKKRKEALMLVRENISEMDRHLLSYNTNSNAPKSIQEIFVMPHLTKIDKLEESEGEFKESTIDNFEDIINSDDNFIIFGIKEAGKTIMLDRILLEFIEKRKDVLPARLDFHDINKDIVLILRNIWGVNKSNCEKILASGNVVILIDNISFTMDSQDRLFILNEFCRKYTGCRFIGTSLEKKFRDLSFNADSLSIIDYQRIEIAQFRTKQIKELARKWISRKGTGINVKKLNTLLEAFSHFNLPRTPFSVSMFLWILEREDSYRALNNSVLIESFIIELLKAKDGKSIGARAIFDYSNKLVLLSEIAEQMLRENKDNYALSHSSILNFIENYLTELDFNNLYQPYRILNDLLDTGILIEDGSNIRFKFACFFEFMLAKRMEFSAEFKKEVLAENNFFYFYNEIIYYTGLHRGEKEILQMLIDQLEYYYIDINDIVFKRVNSIDDFFNVDRSLVEQITADDLFNVLPEKETEEEKNIKVDRKYEVRSNGQDQNIIKRKNTNKFENYNKILLLTMNVLRNSEEIKEENMKYNSYKIILRNSIAYCMLYKLICESFVKHSNKFPSNRIEEFMFILRILPNIHQELLSNNLGTFKLSEVFYKKVEEDNLNITNVSEFERFLSVFMYADVRGAEFKNVTVQFIQNFNKKYVADACYLKLLFYYYKSSEKNFDDFLLKNLVSLYIRVNENKNGKKRIDRSKIIQQLKDRRKEIQRDTK